MASRWPVGDWSQLFTQPVTIRHHLVPAHPYHGMIRDTLQAIWVCWLVAARPHEGGKLRHRDRPAGQIVAGQINWCCGNSMWDACSSRGRCPS